MLTQKQIENMLLKASEGVKKYFGEENSRF